MPGRHLAYSRSNIDPLQVLERTLGSASYIPTAEERATFKRADIRLIAPYMATRVHELAKANNDEDFSRTNDGRNLDLKDAKLNGTVSILPHILSGAHNYFGPSMFKRLGITADGYSFQRARDAVDLENINLATKIEFNRALDELISRSSTFRQITTDYDITSTDAPEAFRDASNKAAYSNIGQRRLRAFQKAVEQNRADMHVCMRVWDQSNTLYADRPAEQLEAVGVKVFNHDDGEKFISMRIYEESTDWRYHISRHPGGVDALAPSLGIEPEMLASMAEHGTPRPSLLELSEMEEIVDRPLVHRRFVAATIDREAAEPGVKAGQPQLHRYFYGLIFSDWPALSRFMEEHINRFTTPADRASTEGLAARRH